MLAHSGKSFHSQGDDSTVYGYGKLQRWLDAEPDKFGRLEFLEYLFPQTTSHTPGLSVTWGLRLSEISATPAPISKIRPPANSRMSTSAPADTTGDYSLLANLSL
jgi:hypothetical protein